MYPLLAIWLPVYNNNQCVLQTWQPFADSRTEMIRVFTAYLLPGFIYAVFKEI